MSYDHFVTMFAEFWMPLVFFTTSLYARPPKCKNGFPRFFLGQSSQQHQQNMLTDTYHCNCQPIVMEPILNSQLVEAKRWGDQIFYFEVFLKLYRCTVPVIVNLLSWDLSSTVRYWKWKAGKRVLFLEFPPNLPKRKTWVPTCLPKLFLGCQPLFYFKNFQNYYWNPSFFYMFQEAKCFLFFNFWKKKLFL